jgi:hypothetical protein
MKLLERAYGLSRIAFMAIVVLGAASIAGLSIALIRQTGDIESQQDRLNRHVVLIESALTADCRTRDVIRQLSLTTVQLLETQQQTPATRATIAVFKHYARQLKNDAACNALQRNRR